MSQGKKVQCLTPQIKRKISVYLDEDLRNLIQNELNELHTQGFYEMTPGDIVKKRCREAYGISRVSKHVG